MTTKYDVGDRVLIKLPGDSDNAECIVQAIGVTREHGVMYALDFIENAPSGEPFGTAWVNETTIIKKVAMSLEQANERE